MKNWTDYVGRLIYHIVQVIFLASIVYMIWYIVSDHAPLIEHDPIDIVKNWTYIDQLGGSEDVTTPCWIDKDGRDTFVFESKLPDDLPGGCVVAFLSKADLTVEVDGKVIKDWKRTEAPIIGGPAKNSYFIIPLSQSDSGKDIRITMSRLGFSGKMFDVFVGEKYEVVRFLEKKNGIVQFALSLVLLLTSFAIVISGAILEALYKVRIKLRLIALGILVVSMWMVADSFVFQFVFRTQFIDGLMSYMTTISLIFPFIAYLNAIQENRYSKYYVCLSIFEFISLVVFLTLHLIGVYNFSDSLLWIDVDLGIGIVVCLVIAIVDIYRKKARNYRYVSYGFLVLMVLSIVEIVLINTVIERVEGGVIIAGLFALFTFAIVQQIVEVREVQLERNRANEEGIAKTKFLASMSHEIRTPINSILGMNEMIMKESTDPDILNYSKIISDSGTMLLSLINDILDFSKIENDMAELVCVNYDPDSMFTHITDILRTQAQRKGLEVKVGKPRNLPRKLYGDDKKITQIVVNLVTNAVKYTEEGSITFSGECFEESDKYLLCFYVSDTGIGIRSEDIDSIFDPFQRTDLRKNQSIQGTGLGLSIVKNLVEKMGGQISVESVYGKGSTFSVRIPQGMVEDSDLDARYNSGNAVENDSLDDIDENYIAPEACILEVDDNRSNQIVVREFLKDTKATIDIVSEGKEAVRMCLAKKYDVILMDHMMPGMNGIEAMHEIRKDANCLNFTTPIIVLTANAVMGSRALYEAEGFDNYLSKPVESVRLQKMVRKYLPENKVFYKPKSAKKGIPATPGERRFSDGPVDMQALLARFDNKEDTVNMILEEVVKEGMRKIPLIRQLAADRDMKRYAVEAHGVKGAMESACITDLAATAKSHELAAKEDNVSFVTENVEVFLKEYGDVLEFIEKYLGEIG